MDHQYLLAVIASSALTVLIMLGVFYICYPDSRYFEGDKIVCKPEKIDFVDLAEATKWYRRRSNDS